MTEIVKVSLHGHSDIGSHGENIYHESDISIEDKITKPVRENYVDSTSDHDSTYALYELADTIKYEKLEHPHISQIEVSTPGHIILTGPMETIRGIEKEYKLREMLLQNKSYLKMKNPDAVTQNILGFLEKFVGGNDKVIAGLPHPLDTLNSGIVGKYPAEEALKIIRSKHVNYLEAFNGMNEGLGNYYNATIAILAKENYGKNITVGADYHTTKMMGTNLNVLEVENLDETSILKALKNGKVVGFENLMTASLMEMKDWGLNRVKLSKNDMIEKSYTDDWTKDSSWSYFTKFKILQKLMRFFIRYAADYPDSKAWDSLAGVGVGVNYLYERLKMTPKYRKFVMEITDGRVNSYEPLNYRKFRKDPLRELEKIAVTPHRVYSCL